MRIRDSVEAALAAVETTPADQAVVTLALAYAESIDNARDADDDDPLPTLGPKLLTALDHLLLTPKARAAITKEIHRDVPDSPLDELRAKRRERASGG